MRNIYYHCYKDIHFKQKGIQKTSKNFELNKLLLSKTINLDYYDVKGKEANV